MAGASSSSVCGMCQAGTYSATGGSFSSMKLIANTPSTSIVWPCFISKNLDLNTIDHTTIGAEERISCMRDLVSESRVRVPVSESCVKEPVSESSAVSESGMNKPVSESGVN